MYSCAFLVALVVWQASLHASANLSQSVSLMLFRYLEYIWLLLWKNGSRDSTFSLNQLGCIRRSAPSTSLSVSVSADLYADSFSSIKLLAFHISWLWHSLFSKTTLSLCCHCHHTTSYFAIICFLLPEWNHFLVIPTLMHSHWWSV